ncbi:MAG: MauE/DoxX family redox-associated membrane protein [Bacteroidota bacterium]
METDLSRELNMIQIIWKEGPRICASILFACSSINKLINPGAFFVITNALRLPGYIPEILLSSLIVFECIMVGLLIAKPELGLLASAAILTLFAVIIGILQMMGIHELTGCFAYLIESEVGYIKILQNIGIALLLLASWAYRNEQVSSQTATL